MQIEKLHLESLLQERHPVDEVPVSSEFSSGFSNVFTKKNAEQTFASEKIIEKQVELKAFSEQEIAQSRMKGYEEGYAKGYADAKSASEEIDKKLDSTLANIESKLESILKERKFDEVKGEKDIVDVIIRIAKKVSGTELSINSESEIEKVVKKSFELLFDQPKIVVYVSNELVDRIKERIKKLSKSDGFKGDIEVLGRDNISAGECQIEWQGGGMKSSKESIWDEINSLL